MTAWQPHLAFPTGLGTTWPLVARDFPIAVCWAHKSANTTMLTWFLFQTGLLDQAERKYPNQLHLFWYAHTSAQPDYADQCFRALAGPVRKLTVKVIRDPAQRAVSGFLHFVRDPTTGFRETWNQFLEWKQSMAQASEPTASFVEFLRFAINAETAGTLCDPHLQPQWNPNQDPFVMHHIPLEHLAPRLGDLEQLCGLRPSPLAELSQSLHHSPPSKGAAWPREAARLPLDWRQLRSLGTPQYDVLLDHATLPLIHQAFAADYEAYAEFYAPAIDDAAGRHTAPSVTSEWRAAA